MCWDIAILKCVKHIRFIGVPWSKPNKSRWFWGLRFYARCWWFRFVWELGTPESLVHHNFPHCTFHFGWFCGIPHFYFVSARWNWKGATNPSSTWPYMLLVYLHLWVVSKHTPTFVRTVWRLGFWMHSLLMILCWIVSFGLRDLNTTCCRMRTIDKHSHEMFRKNEEVFSVQYLGCSRLYTHNLYQFVHILHACVGSKKYTRSTAATKRWPINPCLRWLAVPTMSHHFLLTSQCLLIDVAWFSLHLCW